MSELSFLIRQATADDVEGILAIWLERPGADKQTDQANLELYRSDFRDRVLRQDDEFRYWVADASGQIIGWNVASADEELPVTKSDDGRGFILCPFRISQEGRIQRTVPQKLLRRDGNVVGVDNRLRGREQRIRNWHLAKNHRRRDFGSRPFSPQNTGPERRDNVRMAGLRAQRRARTFAVCGGKRRAMRRPGGRRLQSSLRDLKIFRLCSQK